MAATFCWTPHRAAELNRKEAAEALLDYGCNPAIAECNGRTAIHLAARGGHVEMLQTITVGHWFSRFWFLCSVGSGFCGFGGHSLSRQDYLVVFRGGSSHLGQPVRLDCGSCVGSLAHADSPPRAAA